jgi:hypothetical protein
LHSFSSCILRYCVSCYSSHLVDPSAQFGQISLVTPQALKSLCGIERNLVPADFQTVVQLFLKQVEQNSENICLRGTPDKKKVDTEKDSVMQTLMYDSLIYCY